MNKMLKNEMEELEKLPETDQNYLAEQLANWRKLRSAIAAARQQVAEGRVRPFDPDEIIRKARSAARDE